MKTKKITFKDTDYNYSIEYDFESFTFTSAKKLSRNDDYICDMTLGEFLDTCNHRIFETTLILLGVLFDKKNSFDKYSINRNLDSIREKMWLHSTHNMHEMMDLYLDKFKDNQDSDLYFKFKLMRNDLILCDE